MLPRFHCWGLQGEEDHCCVFCVGVEGKGAVERVTVSIDQSKYAWSVLKVKQVKMGRRMRDGCW